MFDWISHNKELFLQSHTEIGVSYQHAVELQTQHNHFAMNSMVRHSKVMFVEILFAGVVESHYLKFESWRRFHMNLYNLTCTKMCNL